MLGGKGLLRQEREGDGTTQVLCSQDLGRDTSPGTLVKMVPENLKMVPENLKMVPENLKMVPENLSKDSGPKGQIASFGRPSPGGGQWKETVNRAGTGTGTLAPGEVDPLGENRFKNTILEAERSIKEELSRSSPESGYKRSEFTPRNYSLEQGTLINNLDPTQVRSPLRDLVDMEPLALVKRKQRQISLNPVTKEGIET